MRNKTLGWLFIVGGFLVLLGPTFLALTSLGDPTFNVMAMWVELTVFLGAPGALVAWVIGGILLALSRERTGKAGQEEGGVGGLAPRSEERAGTAAGDGPEAGGRLPHPSGGGEPTGQVTQPGLNAVRCVIMALFGGGALGALCAWVASLKDYGGDFFVCLIAPLVLGLYVVGGPLALAFGVRAWGEARIGPDETPRAVLLVGLALSGLVTLAPFVLTVWRGLSGRAVL